MDFMVHSITLFQTAEHCERSLIIGFVNLDHLETAFQRGVFFKVLFVFAPGCRCDGTQFTPRQSRL